MFFCVLYLFCSVNLCVCVQQKQTHTSNCFVAKLPVAKICNQFRVKVVADVSRPVSAHGQICRENNQPKKSVSSVHVFLFLNKKRKETVCCRFLFFPVHIQTNNRQRGGALSFFLRFDYRPQTPLSMPIVNQSIEKRRKEKIKQDRFLADCRLLRKEKNKKRKKSM